MTEATIIVIHKEGKDLHVTSFYKPISLLCADIKLLARILNRIMDRLIHMDQLGFIPGRLTRLNIRKTFLKPQVPVKEGGSQTILSLDAAKAFNRIMWDYLWQVLAEFGFGLVFTRWVNSFYRTPKVRLRINNGLSEYFSLARGTKQGCPLSPCSSPWPQNHQPQPLGQKEK